MNAKHSDTLLPDGMDVPFSQIEPTLARLVRDHRRRRAPSRALTATVIVVGPENRLGACAETMERLGLSGGVRSIFITEGGQASPTARVSESSIVISGLSPQYLNNAVAALRLSSLPSLVWWRGGSVESLTGLADLSDRLVLDLEQPDEVWAHADDIVERAAVTDLRWTRLTRWRALLAHVFDLPQVRRAAPAIARLSIDAADGPSARLFAGWLQSSLKWQSSVAIEIQPAAPAADGKPIERVQLTGGDLSITLQVRSTRTCIEAIVSGVEASSRVVPCGDSTLAALLSEELAVRTRDLAFEQALASARELTP
ncbi:MAG TPA: glucose-6-phosphate dehydrogenase assembly protein OpcA [Vicinamibacterales bacterium]